MNRPQIEIIVRGEPVAQPRLRHRLVWPKGEEEFIKNPSPETQPFVHAYTPATTKEWRSRIKAAALPVMPVEPWSGPVVLDVTLYLPRPQRLMSSKHADGPVPFDVRPDRDNLDKVVLDALTEAGLWLDDKQVFGGSVWKWYHGKDAAPGAKIIATHWVQQLSLLEVA